MLKRAPLLVKTPLFFLFFALAYLFCDKATWGFTVARLTTHHDLGFSDRGSDPRGYLHQKFYLYAQGGQSYVFLSADEKIVLKLFKDMPRPWVVLPSYQQKKLGKLKRTIGGYLLAYDRLREETGLLALHLHPDAAPMMTTLVDRLHIEHQVDLSSAYFILQQRAEPLTSKLSQFPDRAAVLAQIRQLLQKRSLASIADHDPRLLSNLGWINGHLVFIDPGRFVEDANASPDFSEKFLQAFLQ